MISFGHIWAVELANINFFSNFILSCQQFDNCSHCLQPVSFTQVANLPPVSLGRWQLATVVIDTSGKFATGTINAIENGGKICYQCR
jgi:hypothetical protein